MRWTIIVTSVVIGALIIFPWLNEYGTILADTGKGFLASITSRMSAEQTATVDKVQKAQADRIKSLARMRKTATMVLVVAKLHYIPYCKWVLFLTSAGIFIIIGSP